MRRENPIAGAGLAVPVAKNNKLKIDTFD